MLVASVDVSFGADSYQLVKVMNVDVDKDAEQTRQDFLASWGEGIRERDVHSYWNGEIMSRL